MRRQYAQRKGQSTSRYLGAMLLIFTSLLVVPPIWAKVVNVFPPQQLLAVGRSNISAVASLDRCHERFNVLLQAKIEACLNAGGQCYCKDADSYPLYQKYYPAQGGGVWMTSRRMTFRCWKVTSPDTCGRCVRIRR
jgi:hypothetical protein